LEHRENEGATSMETQSTLMITTGATMRWHGLKQPRNPRTDGHHTSLRPHPTWNEIDFSLEEPYGGMLILNG